LIHFIDVIGESSAVIPQDVLEDVPQSLLTAELILLYLLPEFSLSSCPVHLDVYPLKLCLSFSGRHLTNNVAYYRRFAAFAIFLAPD